MQFSSVFGLTYRGLLGSWGQVVFGRYNTKTHIVRVVVPSRVVGVTQSFVVGTFWVWVGRSLWLFTAFTTSLNRHLHAVSGLLDELLAEDRRPSSLARLNDAVDRRSWLAGYKRRDGRQERQDENEVGQSGEHG